MLQRVGGQLVEGQGVGHHGVRPEQHRRPGQGHPVGDPERLDRGRGDLAQLRVGPVAAHEEVMGLGQGGQPRLEAAHVGLAGVAEAQPGDALDHGQVVADPVVQLARDQFAPGDVGVHLHHQAVAVGPPEAPGALGPQACAVGPGVAEQALPSGGPLKLRLDLGEGARKDGGQEFVRVAADRLVLGEPVELLGAEGPVDDLAVQPPDEGGDVDEMFGQGSFHDSRGPACPLDYRFNAQFGLGPWRRPPGR